MAPGTPEAWQELINVIDRVVSPKGFRLLLDCLSSLLPTPFLTANHAVRPPTLRSFCIVCCSLDYIIGHKLEPLPPQDFQSRSAEVRYRESYLSVLPALLACIAV